MDPSTGLPPRVEPKSDWFDPEKPAKADPRTDWQIEIYDGRYVGCIYKVNDEPKVFLGTCATTALALLLGFHGVDAPDLAK